MIRRWLTAGLRRAYRFWFFRMVPRLSMVGNSWRKPEQIVSRWPEGPFQLGPRACVFVHWDGAGEVREYVRVYLQALRDAGVSIVFVTNAGWLRPESMAAVRALCAGVIVRRNIGYDFGAWRDGIAQLGLPRPGLEMLLLVNDSLYGPLAPLGPLLDRMDFAEADVWGCTETWQSRYHLQSFLLAFSPQVLASPAWAGFWRRVRPANKHWVVHYYEIGLSQAMLKAGFRLGALWSYRALLKDVDPDALNPDKDGPNDAAIAVRREHAHRIRTAATYHLPMNPTAELWRQLLRAGFPFLKRELLRSNPSKVMDVADWADVVAETVGGDIGPIDRDLQRTLRGRAP